MTRIWICLVEYTIDSVEWTVMLSPYTGRTETGLNESRVGRFRNNTDCHGKAETQHWKVSTKGSTNICQQPSLLQQSNVYTGGKVAAPQNGPITV